MLTRDEGFWKPSGAPFSETIRRLGVSPEECLAVGDNRYDLDAARRARCGRVVILNEKSKEFGGRADWILPELEAFLRLLEKTHPS